MKKIVLLLAVSCFAFLSNAQNDIVVDANASVRTIAGQFDAIKVSGGIDLYLSQSDHVAIAVSAGNENFKEGIKTVIEDGTLKIFYKGENSWRKKDSKLRAYVSFKDIKKLEASGACDVMVMGSISTATLAIQMSGACDFSGKVKTDVLKLNLSGASDAKISGTAGTAVIESSGASDVKAYDLVTDICKVNVSGASDVFITVNTELTASATGASDIKYKGNAVVKEMRSSGASSVSKKN
ncbi:MAG: head GIN domain-containing protein [Ferruginibacter sp.]